MRWPKCSICVKNMRYSPVKNVWWCSACDRDPPGLAPALEVEDDDDSGWWFTRIFR